MVLPYGSENKIALIKRRSTDVNGDTIGTYHSNPLLNTVTYDAEFPDGAVRHFGANVIAQNLYSQVDENGHSEKILKCILESNSDDTVVKTRDIYLTTKTGQR